MPALLIADIEVRNPDTYAQYRTAKIEAFYASPEYAAIRRIRWQGADSRLVAFETQVPGGAPA